MNADPDGIPFVLTQAEKSKAAWARIAIEHHVRETNRRDQQKADAARAAMVRMAAEINARSPQQVARMERKKGLRNA